MFCSNCGNKLNSDEKFCSVCGFKIKGKNTTKNELKKPKERKKLVKNEDVSIQDLTKYLQNVKMLETRKFALINSIDIIDEDITTNLPNQIKTNNNYTLKNESESSKKTVITFLAVFFGGVIPLGIIGNLSDILCLIMFPIWIIASIVLPIKCSRTEKKKIREYNKNMEIEKEKNKNEVIVFNNNIQNEIESLKSKRDEIEIELDKTNNLLNELYELDFIHKKYQGNFVAIVSFLEYFDTGRCDTLQGYTGAYNIYENEIRQNTIISQLDDILYSLEQIKQNQFAVYCAIQDGNKLTKSLLESNKKIADNSRMAAENSEITNYLMLYN